MRPPLAVLFVVFLLAGGVRSQAQEQERKLIDRIMAPDMSLEYTPEKGGFFGAKSYDNAGSARVKEFNLQQKFRPKDYLTGAYSDQKGFWKGDFKYSTTEAETSGKGMAKRIVKDFDTKEVAVKTSRDAGKGYGITEFATKSTEFKGRSQYKMDTQGPQAMDSIQSGSFTQLKTIDDVRQLLNKNE